ncbi:MAG TPA: hypothetical protein VN458_10345 [Solirubrobacterales bacterium]|nr:hypothetical protein [Solirubrobacterales bacterium]
MSTPAAHSIEPLSEIARLSSKESARLIRQASVWLPRMDPEPLPLQDLEWADGIRWVDIYGGDLGNSEVLALLAPICRGELTAKMVRDLITPKRFATGGSYRDSEVIMTSGFRIRHLDPVTNGSEAANGNGRKVAGGHPAASIFEPLQILVGQDWVLSCWLPTRVFRGLCDPVHVADESSSGLYLAVAKRWPTSNATDAAGLVKLVRRELAVAAGYRPPIN